MLLLLLLLFIYFNYTTTNNNNTFIFFNLLNHTNIITLNNSDNQWSFSCIIYIKQVTSERHLKTI